VNAGGPEQRLEEDDEEQTGQRIARTDQWADDGEQDVAERHVRERETAEDDRDRKRASRIGGDDVGDVLASEPQRLASREGRDEAEQDARRRDRTEFDREIVRERPFKPGRESAEADDPRERTVEAESASDTLPGLLLVVFFQTLLWTAGVHGPAFLSGIVTPVFLKALDENSQAVAAHQAPPHIVTIMLSIFYFPGGSGATLPLTLVMLRSRIARLRKLAMASILPTVWNVNETIIFGVPLVMNPSLTIPFLLVPLVLATITYLATWLNLVGHTIVYLPPVFPSFVTAWLTTAGDWRAIVLVFINIAVGAIIYAPFFRAYEKAVVAQPSEQNRLLREAEAIREQERDQEMHPERSTQ